MKQLHISDVTILDRRTRPSSPFAKGLAFCSAVMLCFGVMSQSSYAQGADSEAEEPLTAEDIADGVAAVNALKKDKAKVAKYCSAVDMIDDGEGEDGAAPADPKAEEALEAKVEGIISSLGEDFSDAYYALEDLPEGAALGKPLVAAFEDLDKACED